MPYPAGHHVAVKRSIVDSARRLFNRYGFDNVSWSMVDRGLADELRDTCMTVALRLGGGE